MQYRETPIDFQNLPEKYYTTNCGIKTPMQNLILCVCVCVCMHAYVCVCAHTRVHLHIQIVQTESGQKVQVILTDTVCPVHNSCKVIDIHT